MLRGRARARRSAPGILPSGFDVMDNGAGTRVWCWRWSAIMSTLLFGIFVFDDVVLVVVIDVDADAES